MHPNGIQPLTLLRSVNARWRDVHDIVREHTFELLLSPALDEATKLGVVVDLRPVGCHRVVLEITDLLASIYIMCMAIVPNKLHTRAGA